MDRTGKRASWELGNSLIDTKQWTAELLQAGRHTRKEHEAVVAYFTAFA
jgi:hypothetical protein